MNKVGYRIQEVSTKLHVPRSTIRYWEGEFTELIKPKRTDGGQRRYSGEDIDHLAQIKEILHNKNKTIDQAKRILKTGNVDTGEIDWKKQSILLTGGTGSFGKHFCKIMLEKYRPKVIRIYSRGELNQHEMRQEFGEEYFTYFIGDVRDADRLKRAMEGVDIVVHAAALKQVPACEYNPLEAVKTNIHGAQNIIDAAIDAGVKKVIALSTEKAVNPLNLYGATKLCAEKIFIQGNSYSGQRSTRFSCVRYGNVIRSRKSLISLFSGQKKSGKIIVPDKKMTRFWITLDHVVEAVINILCHMHGGEIFVPKIPSINVLNLAKAISPASEIEVVGLRPGEKLHEILITEDEGRNAVSYDGMYVIMPNYSWWEKGDFNTGRILPEGFIYASNTNDQQVRTDDVKKFLYGPSESDGGKAPQWQSRIYGHHERVILHMINSEECIPENRVHISP